MFNQVTIATAFQKIVTKMRRTPVFTLPFFLLLLVQVSLGFGNNSSCEMANMCCAGRNHTCFLRWTLRSGQTQSSCYCDEYCVGNGDCCSDYRQFCNKLACNPEFEVFGGTVQCNSSDNWQTGECRIGACSGALKKYPPLDHVYRCTANNSWYPPIGRTFKQEACRVIRTINLKMDLWIKVYQSYNTDIKNKNLVLLCFKKLRLCPEPPSRIRLCREDLVSLVKDGTLLHIKVNTELPLLHDNKERELTEQLRSFNRYVQQNFTTDSVSSECPKLTGIINDTTTGDVRKACPRGSQRIPNINKCADCPAGFFEVNNDCIMCNVDTYQEESGQTNCKPCRDGHITEDTGAYSEEQCIAKDPNPPHSQHEKFETVYIVLTVVGCGTIVTLAVVIVVVKYKRKKIEVDALSARSGNTGTPIVAKVTTGTGRVAKAINAYEDKLRNANEENTKML